MPYAVGLVPLVGGVVAARCGESRAVRVAAVAHRIVQYANIMGKENVIAGVDCGFGTFAGRAGVHPEVVWAKLGARVEGSRAF